MSKSYKDELYKLVGKKIKIDYTITEGLQGRAVSYVKWLVTEAYPWYVVAKRTCENGYEVKECFNVGTLVAKGILSGNAPDHKFYSHYNNGWGI